MLDEASDEFISFVANEFRDATWRRQFLAIGRYKRKQAEASGKRVHPWVRRLELRLPVGCNAACSFCGGYANRNNLSAPSAPYLEGVLAGFNAPELLILCADWGDPCLHPALLRGLKSRIETDWRVTRFNLLTNLTLRKPVEAVLPYTQTLLVNCSMASREEAAAIMGYRRGEYFDRVMDNLHALGRKCRGSYCTLGVVYVMTRAEPQPVFDHYRLMCGIDGVDRVTYKYSWRSGGRVALDEALVMDGLERLRHELDGPAMEIRC